MGAILSQHVRNCSGEMVADVVAKKAEHTRPIVAWDERVAHENYRIGLRVEARQAETAKLLEQAARVHVARDRAGQRLETGRGTLPLERAWPAALVVQPTAAHPACKDLRGRGGSQHHGRRHFACDSRDLAPREAGRGADTADIPLAASIDLRGARRLYVG